MRVHPFFDAYLCSLKTLGVYSDLHSKGKTTCHIRPQSFTVTEVAQVSPYLDMENYLMSSKVVEGGCGNPPEQAIHGVEWSTAHQTFVPIRRLPVLSVLLNPANNLISYP